ncbi:MAG: hypothetical protein KGL35_11865 [Bradyrhizobium sp.]|nr:hypothetical protein [Bradyrhizobium sp.]
MSDATRARIKEIIAAELTAHIFGRPADLQEYADVIAGRICAEFRLSENPDSPTIKGAQEMTKDNPPPFWLVWNPNRNAAQYKHPSEKNAEEEAHRLAKACPGETFYVLAPVTSITKSDVTIERFNPDHIPF